MNDPKHEAEVKALHELFQEILIARTGLKKALEEEALARSVYDAAKSKSSRRLAEVTEKTKELSEGLEKTPIPRTLAVMAAEINEANIEISKARKGASNVGSSVQGQVGEKPD